MVDEKYNRQLVNIFYQYTLLTQNTKQSEKLLSLFSEQKGNLSIAELSEATGVPKEKLEENYFRVMFMLMLDGQDVIFHIMKTHSFVEKFKKSLSYKSGMDITIEDAGAYLDDFLNRKRKSIVLMQGDKQQNVVGYCLTSIENLQVSAGADVNNLYKSIAAEAKNLNGVSQEMRDKALRAEDKIYFSPNRFFRLVTEFNKLQGEVTTGGKSLLLVSLIDILAYLTDKEIIRSNDGTYTTTTKYNSTTNVNQCTDYKQVLSEHSVINKDGKYRGKENVYLVANFSGVKDDKAGDKLAKQKTYHSLVSQILERKYDNCLDFILGVTNHSLYLTGGKYSSNSPILNAKEGYTLYTANNSEVVSCLGKEVIQQVYTADDTRQMLLKNKGISKILKIADACSVIDDIIYQMGLFDINWMHLKRLYKLYRSSGIMCDIQFKSVTEAFAFYRLHRIEEESYFYQEPEETCHTCRLAEITGINSLKELYNVFVVDSVEKAKKVSRAEVEPDELFEKINTIYTTHLGYDVFEDILEYKELVDCCEEIQQGYLEYIRKYGTSNESSSLLYGLKYDNCINKVRKVFDRIKTNTLNLKPCGECDIIAYDVILHMQKFITSFEFDLTYSLDKSYEVQNIQVKEITSDEEAIYTMFLSNVNKGMRTMLETYLKINSDSNAKKEYLVDAYGLYKRKSNNRIVIEDITSEDEVLNCERRVSIANCIGVVLTAKKENGVWKIESFY